MHRHLIAAREMMQISIPFAMNLHDFIYDRRHAISELPKNGNLASHHFVDYYAGIYYDLLTLRAPGRSFILNVSAATLYFRLCAGALRFLCFTAFYFGGRRLLRRFY